MLLSKATYIAFKLQFYILSALASPGNRTHDLGVASAMLYHLSYRKAVCYVNMLPLGVTHNLEVGKKGIKKKKC